MLNLHLIASECGVLGLKLFHKSSAWKKKQRHIFVSGLVSVQSKWHGTSRSKKKQAETKLTGLPVYLECSLAIILEGLFDCKYCNQMLLWSSP